MDRFVLVLFGGNGWEREGSIISAAAVARSLDRQGVSNRLVEFPLTSSDLSVLDRTVVFNSMHGKFGEDGAAASWCEIHGIPYNFSSPFAHALAFDKLRFKSLALSLGIDTPGILRTLEALNVGFPISVIDVPETRQLILKPVFGGGSRGVQFIQSGTALDESVRNRDHKYDPYFVEEFIDGAFVTCGISGDSAIDASLPLLQVDFSGEVYSYDIKHNETKREYILPAKLSAEAEEKVRRSSRLLFKAMGARAIVRFDYIVHKDGAPYLLEANTIPGLSEGGNLASMWKASGRSFDELISFLLQSIH